MSKIVHTEVKATVKFFDAKKGFGFFKTEEFGDVFVHSSMLGTFQPWELQEGNPAFISLEESSKTGKFQVTMIHEIFVFYLKQQGEMFSLPRPLEFDIQAVVAKDSSVVVLETRDKLTGTVSEVKAGFGFLKVKGQKRPIFFHRTQLPIGVKAEMGMTFTFVVDKNEKGLTATSLSLLDTASEEEVGSLEETVLAKVSKPRIASRASPITLLPIAAE